MDRALPAWGSPCADGKMSDPSSSRPSRDHAAEAKGNGMIDHFLAGGAREAATPSTAIRELREIGRIAVGLGLLALVVGILSLRAVERERRSRGARPSGSSWPRCRRANASCAQGDVVERVDGRVPASLAEVEREVASHRPAILLVRRGGREVALAERWRERRARGRWDTRSC
ncbi:hypothetical protein AB5I41_26720 [Sphingomonas sp. MMS24-JH45]